MKKRPDNGSWSTHCAIGNADDFENSLFELVV